MNKKFIFASVVLLVLCTAGFAARMPIPPGYPNADNTGIKGVGLTTADLDTITGPFNITTNGAVIDMKYFPGGVNVNANNVTIKRCRIGIGWRYGVDSQHGSGTVIEDCTLVGVGLGKGAGILAANITVRRCDISGYHDGAKTWSGSEYYDSFIHDLLV